MPSNIIIKPKSFTQENKWRTMRMAKTLTAKEAIGAVKKNTDTFILTFGQFSLTDALVAVLDQAGPATMDLSTWTVADTHLQRSAEMLESSQITRLRMVIDHSFKQRQPDYFAHMCKVFGADCFRQMRTHAKFAVIRSATHDVVIRTSMNLNENPRLENIEVSESKAFADYFTAIVDEIFREVKEGEARRNVLLPELPDNYPFKEVQANHMERETINEPGYTHTLKKL